jgi:lipoprotein-anchoring transpeptidase ErfK/SrfK
VTGSNAIRSRSFAAREGGRGRWAWTAVVALALACAPAPPNRNSEPAPPLPEPSATPVPTEPEPEPEPEIGALRLEVDRSARMLRVLLDDDLIESHPVAVGQAEWPTPTGTFHIQRVDWNPDWIPPEEEWAEGEEPKDPGDPDNPMGRARMVYQETYIIHGTDDTASLGQAASHGSIRLGNEVITELARVVMRHGGAPRSEEWFREALEDRATMRQVSLPDPVPLIIRE